jgi:hypothetical protein
MPERESAQAEYDRKKAEREAEHAARRARLGHETPSGSGPEDPAKETTPGPTGPASDAEDKPKARPRRRTKEAAESEE